MQNENVLKILLAVIMIAAVVVLSLVAAPLIRNAFQSQQDTTDVGYSSDTVRARVISIAEEGQVDYNGMPQTYQVAEVEIMEGEFQNARVFMDFGRTQIMPDDYVLAVGDEILVSVGVSLVNQTTDAYFIDFVRGRAILLIFVLFVVVAFLVGRWTGLRSLLGMLIGLGVIVFFIIPQIAGGANPVLVSIIGSIIFLGLSLYLVYGWKPMTHAAVISMALALSITGALSFIFIRLARLTGFGNEDMMFLMQQSQIPIDMRGILLAGIIIGSLGVLDDLVVGQSSSVFQLHAANPALSFKELFARAMTIGRDHVSASVNTLVLAYAGESLPMLLLFSITNVNLGMAINVSYIAEEIVRALAGTIGLFISIPIATALACVWVSRID
jgi:uncharacterized membrane protein